MTNVEDFDGDFEKPIKKEDVKRVLSYNKNDVIATLKLLMITLGKSNHPMYKGNNKILLRQNIHKEFGLNCLNYDDIKVGTELILRMYCTEGNLNPYQVKKLNTKRPMITGTACIPEWAHFNNKKLNDEVLRNFKKATFFDGITKGVLTFSTIFHGFKVDYGTGGAHGCIQPGVYNSDDEWMILDVDISSMYPNLAITQNIYPKHLGPLFIRVYGDKIVGVRMNEKAKPKDLQNMVIIDGYKLAANGTYGKTKEKNSWLYDPLYPIKTTISGQILLTMWMEYMVEVSPTLEFIQVNTKLPLVL